MTASAFSAIIASAALLILIIGFLIGFARGYQRSLLGLVITLVCAVVAFFLAPVITNAVLEFHINAKVNGVLAVTVKDFIIEIIKSISYVGEAIQASPTLADLVIVLPSLICNVVVFVVGFLLIKLVLWLVLYLPIALTVFSKKRLENKNKIKLLGGGIGAVTSLIFLAVLMVPVFGVVSVTNEMNTDTTLANVTRNYEYVLASDSSAETEDESAGIKELNQITNEVTEYTNAFNNIWVVRIYKAIGIGSLSESAFKHLTTGEANGVKVNVTEEMQNFVKAIPYVNKLADSSNKIDAKFVTNVRELSNNILQSDTITTVSSEIINYVSNKWSDGEKAFGVKMPEVEDKEMINVLISNSVENMAQTTKATLKKDVNAIIDVLDVLVEKDVLETINKENLEADEVISLLGDSEKGVMKNIVQVMSRSSVLKDVLPDFINVGLDYFYESIGVKTEDKAYYWYDGAQKKEVTQTNAYSAEYSNYWALTSNDINWDDEAENIQNILGGLCDIYTTYQNDYVKYNEDKPDDQKRDLMDVIDFAKFGQIFDEIRASQLFANQTDGAGKNGPGKKVYAGLLYNKMLSSITSVSVTSGSDTITIAEKLLAEYSSEGEENNTAVQTSFGQVDHMIKVAKSVANMTSTTTTTDLIENPPSQEDIKELLKDASSEGSVLSGLVSKDNLKNLGVNEDLAKDISTIIGGVSEIDTSTIDGYDEMSDQEKKLAVEAKKADEIDGISAVLDLALQAQGEEKISFEEQEDANKLIEDITKSSVITDILTDDDSVVGGMNISESIDPDTQQKLANSINEYQNGGGDSDIAEALRNLLLNMHS